MARRRPFPEEGIVGTKRLGGCRILDDRADLAAHELGRGIVRALVGEDIVERLEAIMEAALFPAGLEDALTLGAVHAVAGAPRMDERTAEGMGAADDRKSTGQGKGRGVGVMYRGR